MTLEVRSLRCALLRGPRGVLSILLIFVFQLCSGNAYNAAFVRQPPTCVNIPAGLKLCHGVGYTRMILPNLLNHESVDEVQQQAVSFVPLLSRRCHPHLQPFLCSLFAPVCLSVEESMVSGPIPPCRALCESVRLHCLPVLTNHFFSWPTMLNCSQFTDEHPCININISPNVTDPTPTPSNTNAGPMPSTPELAGDICAPCATPLEEETVVDNYCASEFVIKAKLRKLKIARNNQTRDIKFSRKKQEVFKKGPLNKRDLKRLRLSVPSNRACGCPQLDEYARKKKPRRSKRASKRGKKRRGKKGGKKGKKQRKPFFLIMGRKVMKKLLVTVIHEWDKRVLNRLRARFVERSCTASGLNRR